MPKTNIPDLELLAAAREGDRSAYAEIWNRHWRAGVAAAQRYSDIADPEDITQDAFEKIFAAVDSGKGPMGGFRPYLYRTIRNVAISIFRRKKADPVGSYAELEQILPLTMEDETGHLVDRTVMYSAMRQLPERWQEVLWYTAVEGLPPREAARFLGLTPNATAALAVRARKGLRDEWLKLNPYDQEFQVRSSSQRPHSQRKHSGGCAQHQKRDCPECGKGRDPEESDSPPRWKPFQYLSSLSYWNRKLCRVKFSNSMTLSVGAYSDTLPLVSQLALGKLSEICGPRNNGNRTNGSLLAKSLISIIMSPQWRQCLPCCATSTILSRGKAPCE